MNKYTIQHMGEENNLPKLFNATTLGLSDYASPTQFTIYARGGAAFSPDSFTHIIL